VPPCSDCLPELQNENHLAYEVYWRVFNSIENIDPFRIMKMVGVHKDDRLFCLDLIQVTRNEVMRLKIAKGKTNG
jgi:hypothetical protein